MGEITSVDAPRLAAMGDAVQEVAGRLDRLGAGVEGMTHQTVGAIEGSRTSEWAMPDVARNWHGNLERLAADVREFAGNLHQTAADYQGSDLDAYGRMKATGAGF
ncbi:type VII secretion target [Actinoplanes sp. CA-142083]|uniref:type VII secretion target n=1 Tax=Actinoplanes sp. CA-142083 TaxID=3239903 RepID=UPI003D8FAC74